MDNHHLLDLPARRVGPRDVELYDGPTFKLSADQSFEVRINARTTLDFTVAEMLENRLGEKDLAVDLVATIAKRAKLRASEAGFTGRFSLPVFYVYRPASDRHFLLILSSGEWEPGRTLVHVEGVWSVKAVEPHVYARRLNPPVRLDVSPESHKRPWWSRWLERSEQRGRGFGR